jgi:hypothetical protein
MRNTFYKGRFIFIPLAVAAFLSLISLVVMELWNSLLPEILNTRPINFWQAMGIFVLCKILFGFGKGGPQGAPWSRSRMARKFKNMSEDEREIFRQEMENRMCRWQKRSTPRNAETINTEKTSQGETPIV